MDNRQGDDKGPNIQDVKLCMETAFPGVAFKINHGISSYQAVGNFDEFELRVILSGKRKAGRPFHIRLLQKAGRIKRTIVDTSTADPAEAERAIKEARQHIFGMMLALQQALNPPPAKKPRDDIDSLLSSGFSGD